MAERKTERRKVQMCGPVDYVADPELSMFTWVWRHGFFLATMVLEPRIGESLEELLNRFKNRESDDVLIREYNIWAQLYNFMDEWCLQWVLLRWAERWALEHDGDSWPPIPEAWSHVDRPTTPPPVRRPRLPPLRWLPFFAPREEMELLYKDYLDEVEARYRRRGYSSTRELRQPDHFAWLAGYQVRGWSKNRIAEAAGVSRTAVINGINASAESIVLTLRPATKNDSTQTTEIIRTALKLKQPWHRTSNCIPR